MKLDFQAHKNVISQHNFMGELIKFDCEGPVAVVSFNRPDDHNAITAQMWREIPPIFKEISDKDEIRAIVLRGVGKSSFSAGAEIKEFKAKMRNDELVKEYWEIVDGANSAIEDCPKPVIAMIRGVALGAGCALALACDIRYAAENVRMGVPAAHLGLTFGINDTRRLMNAVGATYAREILLTGDRYQAPEALRMGLVNRLIKPDNLEVATMDLAHRISSHCAPLALRESKANIATIMRNPSLSGVDQTAIPIAWAGSADLIEGVDAYFEKRRADFRGR